MARIESLLSARLFLTPQLAGNRVYFLSNLSGQLSLYAMDVAGGIPDPLLPARLALQNPELIGGHVFWVYPDLGIILVMIDRDGDENYQPLVVPLEGGIPEPAFGDHFDQYRVHLAACDGPAGMAYFSAESRRGAVVASYQADLRLRSLTLMASSAYGQEPVAQSADHQRAAMVEHYTAGDAVLTLWERADGSVRLLYGTPLTLRADGHEVPLTGLSSAVFAGQNTVLCLTSVYEDTYSLGCIDLEKPGQMRPVAIAGIQHAGTGEMVSLEGLPNGRLVLGYNIDGCSWLYEGSFDAATLSLRLDRLLCGAGTLRDGVLESARYDEQGDRYVLSFSTAVTPTQLFIVEGAERDIVRQLTHERLLGLREKELARGEDASYVSFDGMHIPARLYLPASELGFGGPRPLVYYIHGGPQGQERPNFAWFSMPLIQFLTLRGFAVFVPNVRGSTGYGLTYTRKVDRDWGGDDRLDHARAMEVLAADARLDTSRAGVIGRSYGGYMTLMLAGRHPDLWSAAVDMFGPSDLRLFLGTIPPTWQPYYALILGDAQRDQEFLVERSPVTYLDQVRCPMLVIQGKNDPRVVESESRAVVSRLRDAGKAVEWLLFENEGHDVLKFENRVTCYNAIADFFTAHLLP